MIFKRWLKLIRSNDDIAKGAKKAADKGAKLYDVAHEALTHEDESKKLELETLVKNGWPLVWQEKFREKVKKKIESVIADELTSEEVIEEVTERIVIAAGHDKHYRKMFDD